MVLQTKWIRDLAIMSRCWYQGSHGARSEGHTPIERPLSIHWILLPCFFSGCCLPTCRLCRKHCKNRERDLGEARRSTLCSLPSLLYFWLIDLDRRQANWKQATVARCGVHTVKPTENSDLPDPADCGRLCLNVGNDNEEGFGLQGKRALACLQMTTW